MNKFILIIFLLLSLEGFTQTTINITASYQPYEKQSIYLGVLIHSKLIWPDIKRDLYYFSTYYGEKYIADPDFKNIYAIGGSFLVGGEYVYLGFNERIVFQEKSNRVDFGPTIRLGYKYVWLEMSRQFNTIDNLFSETVTEKVGLDNFEDNFKIVITIPIHTWE